MRPLIGLLTGSGLAGFGLAASATAMPLAPGAGPALTRVEYFCSDGFAPRGGRCVATASRDEIDLFEVEPDGIRGPRRHRIRHKPLRSLY